MKSDSLHADIRRAVTMIPRGKVSTYGRIARLVGGCNPRMVGYAMAGLPSDSGVPWHRVINHQGRISLRESSCYEIQRILLEGEGIEFDRSGKIDLARYGWPEPDGVR